MKEQELSNSEGMQMFGLMPESYNLDVNANHELISIILVEKSKKKRKRINKSIT